MCYDSLTSTMFLENEIRQTNVYRSATSDDTHLGINFEYLVTTLCLLKCLKCEIFILTFQFNKNIIREVSISYYSLVNYKNIV